MSASKEELFERMPVTKAILNLTIPMIIGSVVSIAYNLADTFFVGQLNDPVQNAAVTLVAPAMTLFYAITNLFGIGASSLMSRKLGSKEFVTTGAGFLRGFGLSLPFMCIDFVVVGVSQSFGFGKYAFAFSILRKAVFEIPFILIFSRIFGLYGLYFCVACAEFLMSVIALAVLRKLLKKL